MLRKFGHAMFVAAVVLCAMGSTGMGAVIISDSFNRADDGINLGATDQGYKWQRRIMSTGGEKENVPGISGNTMKWNASSLNGDAIYLNAPQTRLQDFVLDFDYIKLDNTATNAFSLNFRMNSASGQVLDGGNPAGYVLFLAQNATTNLRVRLYDNYGCSASAWIDVPVSSMTNHLTLVAEGNNIKVYVNDAARAGLAKIDYTDVSANAAKSNSGFFTISNNQWTAAAMDNFVVIPEPVTLGLLACGGIGMLLKRRSQTR